MMPFFKVDGEDDQVTAAVVPQPPQHTQEEEDEWAVTMRGTNKIPHLMVDFLLLLIFWSRCGPLGLSADTLDPVTGHHGGKVDVDVRPVRH